MTTSLVSRVADAPTSWGVCGVPGRGYQLVPTRVTADIPGLARGPVTNLEENGYGVWYVLEQDVMLDEQPHDGEGPVAEVRSSLEHLRGMAR